MPVVAEVRDYLTRRYPKPSVDPEWTVAAVTWLQDQLSLDPNAAHASQELLDNVDLQLLQSDLSDSTLHHTGLPTRVQSMKNGVIATHATGGPILVQVLEVMEIGASAFHLMNVRQARKDGTDLSGLAVGTEEEGGEGAKEAKYPRGMLSLTFSDGSVQVKAIEYKRIEGLTLGETSLGFKLLLKNVRVRNGIALLEPSNIELRGWQNEDMQANQDQVFVRNLRHRMGKPEIDPNEGRQNETAKAPASVVRPPPTALQPYPPSPHPPAQASRPQRALSAAPEPRHEVRELTTSPHVACQAPSAVAVQQQLPSCLPRRVNPPTSGEDEGHTAGQSFGDMDVDDDFWGELDQIEDAERTGGSRRPSATRSTQGSRTAVSSGVTREVIALDDDEESDEPDGWSFGSGLNAENVSRSKVHRVTPPPVPPSQPQPRHKPPTQVQEVIDLSD